MIKNQQKIKFAKKGLLLIVFLVLLAFSVSITFAAPYWPSTGSVGDPYESIGGSSISVGAWMGTPEHIYDFDRDIMQSTSKTVTLNHDEMIFYGDQVFVNVGKDPKVINSNNYGCLSNPHQSNKVNLVTTELTMANYYDCYSAPVTYKGEKWAFWGTVWNPPDSNNHNYFKVQLDWMGQFYPTGYFVRHNGGYYITNKYTILDGNKSFKAADFDSVPQFVSGNSYAANSYVYTIDNGNPRFWKAKTGTNLAPSEDTARQGVWFELENGWVAINANRTNANVVIYHWKEHNVYESGDRVIYGTTNGNRNRIYQANGGMSDTNVGKVPKNSRGMISEYWTDLELYQVA